MLRVILCYLQSSKSNCNYFLKVSSATGSDDYDAPYPSVEEGDSGVSAGRSYGIKQNNPTTSVFHFCARLLSNESLTLLGIDTERFSPIDNSESDLMLLNNEGSNLVDPKPSVAIQEPTLLDFHRDAVETGLFESYTYTGGAFRSFIKSIT